MLKDQAALHRARQVSTTLASMASVEHDRPRDVDRFDWCSEVLDEIARGVSTVGDVIETVTREPDDEIARLAADLATAIVRHRNALLRDGPPPARHASVHR